MEEKDKATFGYLEKLRMASWQVIREKSASGLLPVLAVPFEHIEISGFCYDEKGATYTQSSHETRFKNDWRRAALDIGEVIHKSELYSAISKYLQASYSYPHIPTLLQQYTFQLFDILLQYQPQVIDFNAVEAHQERFVRDLKQTTHPVLATVYLSGLTLESEQINLDTHTILRQTRVTDRESRKQHSDFPMIPFPSSVLEFRYERHYNDYQVVHEAIRRYTKLLRLFHPCSIQRDYFQMDMDTVTAPRKMHSNYSWPLSVWHIYYLTRPQEAAMLHFLQNFKLPANLIALEKKPDYISTAHDRYREALCSIAPIEQRIANAIMGLEALLSDSLMELSFRLSCRTAKLVGLVGYDALKVKRDLGMAYTIRSNYAHGGFIDAKERKKIETKFEPLDSFAMTLIDYLRALFIISTQIAISKKDLLQLIDDSFVDSQSSRHLENTLLDVIQFLPVSI